MNKAELVNEMAEQTSLSKKDVEKVLNSFISTVTETMVRGFRVQLAGFGTFETAERAARQGRNPATGESIEIPASLVPRFKASASLKGIIKGD